MFAILTEDGLDQVVETKAIANREAKDLRAMRCTVRVVAVKDEDEAEALGRKVRGY